MKVVGQKIYHISKWTVLASLILVALLSVAGRTLLSNVEYFKNAIEQELADYGIKGVSLENIEGHWEGMQPRLKIKGASLSIPGRSHALSVNEMSVRVKLIPSLLSGDLILESFHTNIEKLVLVRDVTGVWWLNDIRLTAVTDDSQLDIYEFFLRLPKFVNIDISLVQLRDLRSGIDHVIKGSTLRSSRKKQQLSLEFFTQLPTKLGRNIQFYLTGDEQKQRLYVKGDELNLVSLFQLSSIEKIPLQQAKMSMQSWADLKRFRLQQMITKAKVTQVSFNRKYKRGQSLSFNAQLKTIAEENKWRVHSKINKIRLGTQQFADLKSQAVIKQQGEKPWIWIDQVELSFLNSLLKESVNDDSVKKLLTGMQAEATLNDLVVQLNLENPAQSVLGLQIADYRSSQTSYIPSLNGISGSLVSSFQVAQLNLTANNVSMDFADLFRVPIKLDSFQAKSQLFFKDQTAFFESGNFTASNADVNVEGRVKIQAKAGQPPFISLRGHYRDGKLKAVPAYLPVKIMHDEVVKWIDKSIVSGDIKQGDFLFHGRFQSPAKFADKQTGVMLTRFSVHDPVIDYLEEWPVAEKADAVVEFLNSGMSADISNVKSVNTIIDNVQIQIPDFLATNILLEAKSTNDAKDLLATLSDLPIINVFDEVQEKTKSISGPVNSVLKLDIPIADKTGKVTRVTAQADLAGVAISIPDWMIGIKDLKGRVNIDDEKINAKGLSAKFYGDEITFDINPDKKRPRTNFQLSGNVHLRNLLKLTPDYLYEPVSGRSPWKMSVSVGHQPTDTSAILEISANSNLSGSKLSFPEPVKLSKSGLRSTSFKAELFEKGDFPFDLTFKDRMKVSGLLNLSGETTDNVKWINVSLGGNKAISEKSGIRFAGNTELIEMDEWFNYKDQFFSDNDDGSPPFLKQVKTADVNVERLWLAGQYTLKSKIKLRNDGKLLKGSIDSTHTRGDFELPYRIGALHPFKADLNYFKLTKPELSEKLDIDIADMPNMQIKSQYASYEDMVFSNFNFKSRNESNKFVIEQLDFSRDRVNLKSSGHWQFEPQGNEHVSVFNIDIKGTDFGRAINSLGLGESIQGSTVDFNGQIGWAGKLYNINWASLIGEVELELEDGYLKNVDPGAGRFVGLLSFNALPRRLFLDFGDVVKEGMQFDKIKGKFNINGEILKTDNASLNSVSAKVNVKGTTNLRHQTYDQTMTIIPKIGDTLPIIGTLAAGNAVGWGLLLLQKIFKKPIERSVGIEYKISGSWEKPEVTLISDDTPKFIDESEEFHEIDV